MFARSGKARLEWKSITGISPESYSQLQWWSKLGKFTTALEMFQALFTATSFIRQASRDLR